MTSASEGISARFSTGMSEQRRFERAVAKEGAGIASNLKETGSNLDEGPTFSVLPVDPNQRIPVVSVHDTVLTGQTISEIRKDAKRFAKEAGIIGKHPNEDQGWEVNVDKESLEHAFIRKGAVQIHAITKLPEIIKNAVLVEEDDHKPLKKEFGKVSRLYSALSFRGNLFSVKLTVKEHLENGRRLYDLNAVEVQRETGGKVLSNDPSGDFTSEPTPVSEITIGEIAPQVNGPTFSILPSDGNLDDTFARMFSPFQRSPELRAAEIMFNPLES